jgi:N-acetylated-alpha-linked acidic dipeptidase
VAGDEATQQVSTELPAYVAYQGDGDVTAPLVYVNYGMPEDYRLLAQYGVSVAGKIVIARYGEGWRGLKPRLAQEHGASGCIIYSDPSGDGYAVDKTYPDGPMRPPHGVQRGSPACPKARRRAAGRMRQPSCAYRCYRFPMRTHRFF